MIRDSCAFTLLVALFVFPLRAQVCPIQGTVTTVSGAPLPDVTVFLIKAGWSAKRVAQAQTSPDGAFRFTDSPCGTYTVAPNVASGTTFAMIGMKVDTRKAAALRIVVPDNSRVLPLAGSISRTEPTAVAVPGGPVAAPPVPIDGTWHWDVESRIRRDAVARFGGERAAESYDKASEDARIRIFLETFGEEMNRLQGIHFHDPKKLTAELRATSRWFSLISLPPQIEYAIVAAQSRKLMEEPDQEKLVKESMTAALTLVKATSQGNSAAEAEQVFSRADPATKTAMFLKAVQTQMKERVWPSAVLLYVAYTPGNMPPAFIIRLAPGGGQGWEIKSIPERSELSLRAIRNLLEKLETALPDDTGPVAMAELARLLNLGAPGFTGPAAIRRVFGPEAAEVRGNPVIEDRYIRAAGIFHTLWLVEMAVYY